MSLQGALAVLSVPACALLAALGLRQRRQRARLAELTQDLQRAALDLGSAERISIDDRHPDAVALVTAINHLLAHAAGGRLLGDDELRMFRLVGDHVREAVIVHADTIVYANPHFASLLGTDLDFLLGKRLADLARPDETEFVGESLRRRMAGEPAPERFEVDIPTLQGHNLRLEIATTPIEYGQRGALLITGVEVVPVPQSRGRKSVETEHVPMRDVLDALPVSVLTTDGNGRIDYANDTAGHLLGTGGDSLQGQLLSEVVELVDESDRSPLVDPVRKAMEADGAVNLGRRALLRSRATGLERNVEVSAAPVKSRSSGAAEGCVILLHDVTESRGVARQMSYQATHDALTGLINRQELLRRLGEAIETARGGDTTSVLCFVDLDRFKTVNDSGGHAAGDALLREVAKIMRSAVRDSDTVARLGGDEFALLLSGCPIEKARSIAEDLNHRVAEYRFIWKDRVFSIGASCGIVELGHESGDVEATIAAADSACYMAKRKGSGQVAMYSAREEVDARHSGEVQWLQMLQTAIRDDQFRLYSQPIVSSDGEPHAGPAMELLIRLVDGKGGDMPPSDFLRAAERYRLMSLIDRWVVQAALTAIGHGVISLAEGHSLAINISGQTLGDEHFLSFVVDCFDSTGVDPARICFELSEASVVSNLDAAQRFVQVLHGMGCKFALDDFGSNLGAFSNLKNFAVDYLKIDGSFIRNLPNDNVNQAMVAAMIKLARTLNFKVIAEHVEDKAAVDAVRSMGVDFLQGYAIGRPKPLRDVA
ncbi:MAG: hypothetical protein RLZZ200_2365 [Pseudomonadota bacterium]|jgi:diguanylate cyclase (GGDEF)-like protein/PAS domain S-box-containing protein